MERRWPFAWTLLEEFGKGELQATKVSSMARGSIFEHPMAEHHEDLVALAGIGSLGTSREGKHAERALARWVAAQPWRRLLPELYVFDCTKYLGARQGVQRGLKHQVLLPHEVVSSLGEAGPELFDNIFGRPEQWAAYWEKSGSLRTAEAAEEDDTGHGSYFSGTAEAAVEEGAQFPRTAEAAGVSTQFSPTADDAGDGRQLPRTAEAAGNDTQLSSSAEAAPMPPIFPCRNSWG